VKIERAEGLLLKQKGFRFLPSTFTLDSLVIDIWLQLNIDLIDEGIELFLDEPNVILRILPGEVNILQDLLSSQSHSSIENRIESNYKTAIIA
jgi:hypothetical protein